MDTYLADRLAIADLMTGWMRRDLGQWDKLRELFHPEGLIEVTWFEGKFSDFVDASEQMSSSGAVSKHVVASPVVVFNGDKAIAETDAIILSENPSLGIGSMTQTRFYDLVEKRDTIWKILKRRAIYDMSSFTFPQGPYPVDAEALAKYPREYAPLAYVLDKSGFPVRRVFPTKGSQLEAAVKASGLAWLENGQS